MRITYVDDGFDFLPPIEEPPCVVGVVSGQSNMVHDAVRESVASFEERVVLDVHPTAGTAGVCDVVFDPIGATSIRVGIASGTADGQRHWLSVSLIDDANLPVLIHALIAPRVVLGWIGVDWTDIEYVLRSGRVAYFAIATGGTEKSITAVQQRVAQEVAQSKATVAGVLMSLIAPHGPKACLVRQALMLARTNLAPTDQAIVTAGPGTGDGTSIFALLAVVERK
jgi:hypothetical protein